jgi:hypothetical protein
MGSEDVSSPWHFRELHLLPRVVFAIGAVVFVVTLIARDSALSFLGLSLVFGAVGWNLLGDGLGARPKWKSGIVQGLIALGCAAFCFCVFQHRYYSGDLPYFLQRFGMNR